MSIVFAETVRDMARIAGRRNIELDDGFLILAAVFDRALKRSETTFQLPKGFLQHDPDGFPLMLALFIAILIEVSPDRKSALEAAKSALDAPQTGEKPTLDASVLGVDFIMGRRDYKPPKAPPNISKEKFSNFVADECKCARRIIDAWRSGVSLEHLPA